VFDTAVKIGEFVGGVLYDAFALIYDIVTGIADAWARANEEKTKYGPNSYTDNKYGTGGDSPSDTYVYGGMPRGIAPASVYNVNVNALTPTPEVGRAVVKAISEYERTGGSR